MRARRCVGSVLPAVHVVVGRHRAARPTESQPCEDKVGADWNGNSTVPPAPAVEFPTSGETAGMTNTRSDIGKRKAAADRHRARTVVERAVAELAVVAVTPAVAGAGCADAAGEVIAGGDGLERDAALHAQGRETARHWIVRIAGRRRGVGAELAGCVRSPTVRVAARRHPAAVFPCARADVRELQATSDENGPIAAAARSTPTCARQRVATELATRVAFPAVRIAVESDRAGVSATGSDAREDVTARDRDRRRYA